MKSRIFKIEEVYYKPEFQSLSFKAKGLVLGILTSPHLKLTNFHYIPDNYLENDLSIQNKDLKDLKEEIIASKVGIYFFENWIFIENSLIPDYSKGTNSEVYQEELKRVPDKVIKFFNSRGDSGTNSGEDTTMDTNQQPAISNKQNEGGMGETKKSSLKIFDDPKTIAELELTFKKISVREEIDKMKDWLTAKGRKQRDYIAFARNWLRRAEADLNLKDRRFYQRPVTAQKPKEKSQAEILQEMREEGGL